MRAMRHTSFVLLLVAVAASSGHAANPFADLDAIRVSVEIGGPLDAEGNTERELLAGDLKRFNVFESGLRRALVQQVESCGLLVDRSGTAEIEVGVFGRTERWEGGPLQYLFLVETRAVSVDPKVAEVGAELASPRRVLGLAADADFEQAVIAAALAALPDDLRNCEKP